MLIKRERKVKRQKRKRKKIFSESFPTASRQHVAAPQSRAATFGLLTLTPFGSLPMDNLSQLLFFCSGNVPLHPGLPSASHWKDFLSESDRLEMAGRKRTASPHVASGWKRYHWKPNGTQ
ncbi:MAG: hypothetical protein LBQ54_15760 [Planctomycetaceae bacterium]|jgi:hypothetical protein|nr:hypothetical protein [Planctomycetaceae bacterium]